MELVFELGQPLDDLIPLLGRNGYVLLRKNKLFLHRPSQSEKSKRFTSAGVIQHGNKGSFGKGSLGPASIPTLFLQLLTLSQVMCPGKDDFAYTSITQTLLCVGDETKISSSSSGTSNTDSSSSSSALRGFFF